MLSKRGVVVVLAVVSIAAMLAGCESEGTAPEPADRGPVDPVDWDGTKDSPGSPPLLSDAQSLDRAVAGVDAKTWTLGPDLGPRDHTLIMQAVLGNVPAIVARLPQNQVSSGREVLEAAIQVPEISAYVKSRMRMVLGFLASVMEAQESLPSETREALTEVFARIEEAQTLTEKIDVMQSMVESGSYDGPAGLPRGLETGISILRDGERTIYRPRALFNLKAMVQQDLEGAIAGAIGGMIVAGPPGAGVGAVAGAVGSSASNAVGQLTGWW
jgi:hypothetical protein